MDAESQIGAPFVRGPAAARAIAEARVEEALPASEDEARADERAPVAVESGIAGLRGPQGVFARRERARSPAPTRPAISMKTTARAGRRRCSRGRDRNRRSARRWRNPRALSERKRSVRPAGRIPRRGRFRGASRAPRRRRFRRRSRPRPPPAKGSPGPFLRARSKRRRAPRREQEPPARPTRRAATPLARDPPRKPPQQLEAPVALRVRLECTDFFK